MVSVFFLFEAMKSFQLLGSQVVENLQFLDSFGKLNDRLVHDLLKEEPLGLEAMQVVFLAEQSKHRSLGQ